MVQPTTACSTLAYLRQIQGMVVMAPKDEQELRDMMYTSIKQLQGGSNLLSATHVVKAIGVPMQAPCRLLRSARVRRFVLAPTWQSLPSAIWLDHAMQAAETACQEEGISDVEVVNARFVKPLDTQMIDDVALTYWQASSPSRTVRNKVALAARLLSTWPNITVEPHVTSRSMASMTSTLITEPRRSCGRTCKLDAPQASPKLSSDFASETASSRALGIPQ